MISIILTDREIQEKKQEVFLSACKTIKKVLTASLDITDAKFEQLLDTIRFYCNEA